MIASVVHLTKRFWGSTPTNDLIHETRLLFFCRSCANHKTWAFQTNERKQKKNTDIPSVVNQTKKKGWNAHSIFFSLDFGSSEAYKIIQWPQMREQTKENNNKSNDWYTVTSDAIKIYDVWRYNIEYWAWTSNE